MRLFQNFQTGGSRFGKATLDLTEKPAFKSVFLKPFLKLTEFWKRLLCLNFCSQEEEMKKFLLCFLLVFALTAGGIFAAGGAQAAGTQTGTAPATQKITWWCVLASGIVTDNFSNLGDTPFGKGLMARTGVNVEFLHPPFTSAAATEQFNLIVASGDLPDVMEYNWLGTYAGGPEKAIDDNVILRLNDVFQRHSPNISAYLRANPDIDKMVCTDNGSYYNYPMIRIPENRFSTITMIRKDWLDEYGLQIPATYDDWQNVLTVFKNRKNIVPLAFEQGFLLGNEAIFSFGYNTRADLYLGFDNKVKWGQVDPGFRDYVTMMNRWYREGLLDPDIITLNLAQVSAKMTSGTAGASIGYIGSRMGGWLPPGKASNPAFSLVATPVPVRNRGETANFSTISLAYNWAGGCVAITTKCKNVELAAKLLDYGYSAEGIRYYTYGTEGESYTMVNGVPTFTNLITRNPGGWTMAQALGAYTRSNYNAPSIPGSYLLQYYEYPEQQDALKVILPATSARLIPPLTPTPDESREYATIISEINTYSREMLTKFVLGTESLSNWDNYVRTINNLGLPRALEIQNAALARYHAR